MSYEGYRQCICENGHVSNRDEVYTGPWEEPPEEPTCPICNSEIKWSNSVDITNDDDVGFIPTSLIKNKIPESWEELRSYRTYKSSDGRILFEKDGSEFVG
jgi:hypothetical protein